MHCFRSSGAPRRSPIQAFTLIELLVVVAILGLLAAILFPVFGRAREMARRTSCQSNLKQMGISVQMYAQDYDERYPMAISPNAAGGMDTLFDSIRPYCKGEQLAICVSDAPPLDIDLRPLGAKESSYAVNDLTFRAPVMYAPGTEQPPASLAEVAHPAELPLCWDGSNHSKLEPDIVPLADTQPDAVPANIRVAKRHLEGANCLFGDGHVKFLREKPKLATTNYSEHYWNADPTQ